LRDEKKREAGEKEKEQQRSKQQEILLFVGSEFHKFSGGAI
jgi:hypothetical protein